MVEQAPTKEEASDGAHGEGSNEQKVAQGSKAFKKKSSRNSNAKKCTRGSRTFTNE